MSFVRKSATLTLSAAVTLAALVGCASTPTYEQAHPDISSYHPGDTQLQSKDLVEMTDKMAPDLLRIPEIVQNPNKVVIVMTGIDNHLVTNPGEDLRIYVHRLRVLLNTHARDRLAFVENRSTTEKLQNTEGAGNTDPFEDGSRGAPQAPTRMLPQYALKGEFYEKRNNATSYFLCTFQLTNIKTGEVVWENSYETRSLN